jgi:predicted O-methyltransferase YrrM
MKIIKNNTKVYKVILKAFYLIKELRMVKTYSRYQFGKSYYSKKHKLIKVWALKKTDDDNFYYDLTEKNRKDLVSLLSWVLKKPVNLLTEYQNEITSNDKLIQQIEKSLKDKLNLKDLKMGFGRRESWYIIIRSIKPKFIIETGVHQGVGACVIASALAKNKEEGYSGEYIGIDIDPKAGFLFNDLFSDFGEIIYSDSLEALRRFTGKLDLFINDSDHSSDYENSEYQLIIEKLSKTGIILGDNSHTNSILRDFSLQKERNFVFFKEEPYRHWYPGAGVGISFPRENYL